MIDDSGMRTKSDFDDWINLSLDVNKKAKPKKKGKNSFPQSGRCLSLFASASVLDYEICISYYLILENKLLIYLFKSDI